MSWCSPRSASGIPVDAGQLAALFGLGRDLPEGLFECLVERGPTVELIEQ